MPMMFKFEVYTPYRRFLSENVIAVTLTLEDGDITVYANHSFFAAPVFAGILQIKGKNGEWKRAFISEGILEVKGHNTILMTGAAEWPGEIDRERAVKARAAALETLNAGTFKFESAAASAALRRAEYRLKATEVAE